MKSSSTDSTVGRPRLLYVTNEFFFFYSHRLPVARAARDAGYEVHVAGPPTPGWAPDDFEVGVLEAEGFRLHEFPLARRGVNPIEEMRTALSLFALYRRLRPEMVHQITIKPVLYGGIAARLAGLPSMVSAVTGLGQVFIARGLRASALRLVVRQLYRLALAHPNGRVIVQNAEDGERLVESGMVRAERVVLIPGSGVDLDEFEARPEPAGPPLIILPARLIWEKGIAEFVAAARELRLGGVEARFALLGNAIAENPRAVPEAQLRQWQAEGDVEWWGRLNDMPRAYAESHIVCLPSKYGEGVPKALIEAAACGRAIVSTDIAGCRDVVRDGVNGLLVPPGDVPALARALRRLIEDADLRRRMGAAGPAVVAGDFAVESVVERTLEVYRRLRGGGC